MTRPTRPLTSSGVFAVLAPIASSIAIAALVSAIAHLVGDAQAATPPGSAPPAQAAVHP